jgi:hypothetical protein
MVNVLHYLNWNSRLKCIRFCVRYENDKSSEIARDISNSADNNGFRTIQNLELRSRLQASFVINDEKLPERIETTYGENARKQEERWLYI